MTTEAVPVEGSGIDHEGCPYSGIVFHVEGCGIFWFCNKCGRGDEVFPIGDIGPTHIGSSEAPDAR